MNSLRQHHPIFPKIGDGKFFELFIMVGPDAQTNFPPVPVRQIDRSIGRNTLGNSAVIFFQPAFFFRNLPTQPHLPFFQCHIRWFIMI